MAPLRGGRPLKRWRYVAAFSEELMLCAAAAAIGPARSSWWAVWDRRRGTLHERTRFAGPALVRAARSRTGQRRARGDGAPRRALVAVRLLRLGRPRTSGVSHPA
jgi:hypothetical protein